LPTHREKKWRESHRTIKSVSKTKKGKNLVNEDRKIPAVLDKEGEGGEKKVSF